MNNHYKSRYDRFISKIKDMSERNLIGYTEIHHILPKCLKGTDNSENLIRLTLREHFLAHWLLWKTYPQYLPIASAFLQMNNKNPKLSHKPIQGRITSRTYEKLKSDVYSIISKERMNKVYVKDENGELKVLTKEEYANQDNLKFHTSGRLVVFDKEKNKFVSITTQEYHNNKEKYIVNVKAGDGGIIPEKCKYSFLDGETNETIKITKGTANSLNKEAGYKRYKQVINHHIACKDDNGILTKISLSEYKNKNFTHINTGKLSVYDTLTKKSLSITSEQYFAEPMRYLTSTKGKVLAKDKEGISRLVTKDEFEKGNFVGHTKGLRLVLDKQTNSYVQITDEEFKSNRNRYVGPNLGKVNVINKQTGIRQQISKDMFDSNIHLNLGAHSYLFRAKNKLTGKEKNINIYEWDNIKSTYEIVDYEKFNKALAKKTNN